MVGILVGISVGLSVGLRVGDDVGLLESPKLVVTFRLFRLGPPLLVSAISVIVLVAPGLQLMSTGSVSAQLSHADVG